MRMENGRISVFLWCLGHRIMFEPNISKPRCQVMKPKVISCLAPAFLPGTTENDFFSSSRWWQAAVVTLSCSVPTLDWNPVKVVLHESGLWFCCFFSNFFPSVAKVEVNKSNLDSLGGLKTASEAALTLFVVPVCPAPVENSHLSPLLRLCVCILEAKQRLNEKCSSNDPTESLFGLLPGPINTLWKS